MTTELKSGTYRLTQDVVNPSPDRRYKHNWTAAPVVKAGTVFSVHAWCTGTANETLELRPQDSWSHQAIHRGHELWPLIEAFLAPVAERPSDYLEREGWITCSSNILDVLAQQGKITVADVAAALDEFKVS